MRILAIESSCDETSVAIVEGVGESVKAPVCVIRSQIDIHKAYGGVVPEVAAREHLEYLFPMLKEAGAAKDTIDAIAVTAGPGLAPALRVGVETAKTLAWTWGKPLVPVCHLEGHIYASWLDPLAPINGGSRENSTPSIHGGGTGVVFPALALIVSGGHTELVLMKDHGDFVRLGETIDDAAGEAFDKVAKMLGLPYPGGPEVEKLAKGGSTIAFDFPRAMLDKPTLDFSFAGLKTSVLYTLRNNEASMGDEVFRKNIAASFQEAVVDVLVKKTEKAI
ncbi:tRNA (adenosine(37)-N6)-threonylcarbamoyltransferase complex transferase subunit TsaD, partial [Candidatus Uhrbacteria bacterium]|nr:tRNA (adenosine(37)-N6)-threonylcarbamoyltransferase complex transferase subunit TsaD [Candidatus Uhrbacteria bacterium]